MSLDKGDLKEIKKIVDTSVTKIVDGRVTKIVDDRVTKIVDGRILKSEAYLEDKIDFSISQSEQRFEKKIDEVEKKIDEVKDEIGNFRQEVSDNIDSLSDFNRMAIEKFNKVDNNSKAIKNHEVRIKRLEVKTR